MHREAIVLKGSLLKFEQNPQMCQYLLSTTAVLVEASPYDAIWGIGLAEGDIRCGDAAAWQGSNLLGFCLMQARDMLRARRAQVRACFAFGSSLGVFSALAHVLLDAVDDATRCRPVSMRLCLVL